MRRCGARNVIFNAARSPELLPLHRPPLEAPGHEHHAYTTDGRLAARDVRDTPLRAAHERIDGRSDRRRRHRMIREAGVPAGERAQLAVIEPRRTRAVDEHGGAAEPGDIEMREHRAHGYDANVLGHEEGRASI